MTDIATIDTSLSQAGQFCLLDWLLSQNFLPYGDYEDWRYGRNESLDAYWSVPVEDLRALAQQARAHCLELRLQSEPQAFYRWDGDHTRPLVLSRESDLNDLLGTRWLRPADMPQMDLFMDNTAAIAEKDVQLCLAGRQFGAAQEALEQLIQYNPGHSRLGVYQDLINYGRHASTPGPIANDALGAELAGLQREVEPLAREVLGLNARDFLAFAWRRLAEAMREEVFDSQKPEHHRSFALLQIPDWQALQTCLEADASLYQHPRLMAHLALSYLHNQDVGRSLLMWGLLFERFAEEGELLIGEQGGALVQYWDDFLAFDDQWPSHCFLGYLLIQQPGLVHLLDKLPQQPLSGMASKVSEAVAQLVSVRLAEQDEREARALLKEVCPEMLRCYMNKRNWYVGRK